MGKGTHAEADTAAPAAIATVIDLGPDALPIKLPDQSRGLMITRAFVSLLFNGGNVCLRKT
ncbi:MAG TPA: hypothetical protein VIH87_12185 [Methylocella sp.]